MAAAPRKSAWSAADGLHHVDLCQSTVLWEGKKRLTGYALAVRKIVEYMGLHLVASFDCSQ